MAHHNPVNVSLFEANSFQLMKNNRCEKALTSGLNDELCLSPVLSLDVQVDSESLKTHEIPYLYVPRGLLQPRF